MGQQGAPSKQDFNLLCLLDELAGRQREHTDNGGAIRRPVAAQHAAPLQPLYALYKPCGLDSSSS